MSTNRNPRRWVDESGRVRVIEGWHPSEPDRTGYNVLVGDHWLGTFSSLDGAADAAAASLRFRSRRLRDDTIVLQPYHDPRGPDARFIETELRTVEETDD